MELKRENEILKKRLQQAKTLLKEASSIMTPIDIESTEVVRKFDDKLIKFLRKLEDK